MSQKSRKTKNAKPTDTWTIRGVSHEARTATRVAARKSNMTIGEWVERALVKAVHEQNSSQSSEIAPTMASMMERLLDHVEKTDARLDALEDKKGLLGFWKR